MQIIENKLSKALAPFDKQVTESEEPLDKGYRIWLLSAAKGQGKTTIWLNAITRPESPWHKLFDRIYMISPTAEGDDKLSDLISELKRHGAFWDKLNLKNTTAMIEALKKNNEIFINAREPQTPQQRRQGILGKLLHNRKPHNLVILDDCIADMPGSMEKSDINKLFTTNRHFMTSVIVTTQKYNKLNPLIRCNADYISFWKTQNRREWDTLVNDLTVSEETIHRYYDLATGEPHSFLHISFTSGSPLFYQKFSLIKDGKSS
jgi:hypothetical protein